MDNCLHFETIDSTSSYLKKKYKDYDDLTFVSADFQTNGHGRVNRKWVSNKKENLLFSILMKDKDIIKKYDSLSLASAVTVFSILEELNVKDISIKWPNDVYVKNKKIAGVLLESVSYGKDIEALVIGVGINVNSFSFKEDMINMPTSIYLELNKKLDLEELKEKIYCKFIKTIKDIKNNDNSYLKIVRKNNYLKGKQVYANINNIKTLVYIIDINDDNSLKVKKDNEYIDLYSGEITFHI